MSIQEINLTYILTTRNKFPYLKETLDRLVTNKKVDEEIVVVDGCSTDGSQDYLRKLIEEKKIDRLICEPDVCQAHGSNKGLLSARGQILKIITDDDAFDYEVIQLCKEHMLKNPKIDLLCADVADIRSVEVNQRVSLLLEPRNEHVNYLKWRSGEIGHFWFGDQGLFLRKASLPLLGLWHTGVICIDVEQSLRLTSLRQANIAWYTGLGGITFVNADSNHTRFVDVANADAQRLFNFYVYKLKIWNLEQERSIKKVARHLWQLLKSRFVSQVFGSLVPPPKGGPDAHEANWSISFSDALKFADDEFVRFKTLRSGEFLGLTQEAPVRLLKNGEH